MKLDLENDKKIASSFLFVYCKEYLPQRLGRTLDDVRESEAIWLFMSPAAQIMKMKAEKTCFLYLIKEVNKQLNAYRHSSWEARRGIQETCFYKTSFTNFITLQELMAARRNRPF